MKEHPAFVCRREGHVPIIKITQATLALKTYICACRRCGRMVEFVNEQAA